MRSVYPLLLSVLLCACAVKTKRAPETSPEPVAEAAAAPVPEAAPAVTEAPHPAQTETPAPATAAAPAKHTAPTGVEPTTSLRWLSNGNLRFVKKHLRRDGQSRADIERVSHGQRPHAVVLSCSDSRVPPELVFDQKLGEIFTVRTAGQALDHNSIGSVEYAAEHLGARLIVVMGHTSCGAVKAAFETLGGQSAGTPSLDALVQDIHPRLAPFKGREASVGLEKESWANATGVANDLLARSRLLAEMRAHDQVMVVPALYDLNSGRVTFQQEFKPDVRTPANH